MNKIWILTKKFDEYGSCSEYVAAFRNKPTRENLSKFMPESVSKKLVHNNYCHYDDYYYQLEEDILIEE